MIGGTPRCDAMRCDEVQTHEIPFSSISTKRRERNPRTDERQTKLFQAAKATATATLDPSLGLGRAHTQSRRTLRPAPHCSGRGEFTGPRSYVTGMASEPAFASYRIISHETRQAGSDIYIRPRQSERRKKRGDILTV